MKHQGKQAIAWMVALGTSAVIFGAGNIWLKRLAAHANSNHHGDEHHAEGHSDSHDTESHASTSHGSNGHSEHPDANHGEHGEKAEHTQVADSGHDSSHGDNHGEPAEHKKTKHASAHEAPHVAEHVAEHGTNSHDGKGHGVAAKDTGGHGDTAGPQKHGAHWTYGKDAVDGPHKWGSLAGDFAACEQGKEQSPIDLKGAIMKADAPEIKWHYHPTALNIENNGHTVVANMPHNQNYITIAGEKYTLAQFHFHNPSEHKIAGLASDMELHFVHKNQKGELAVIGVMINEKSGHENTLFKPLWAELPRAAHSKSESHPSLDLAKLLPTHRDFFHYAGSLTTPPCSQGVRWFVLREPMTLSGGQIDMYASLFDTPTNRPVQSLFGREIIQSFGPATVAH
jgi:carbonic anhydrase